MLETYHGYIESGHDALLLFEACRLGYFSRVQRRLSDKERATIRSGSIFVWDEEESGMRRWTDGKTWSPSRVLGCFLTYQELIPKRRNSRTTPAVSPVMTRSTSMDLDGDVSPSQYGLSLDYPSSHCSPGTSSTSINSLALKDGGLVKKSLSLNTAEGHRLHLICYYNKHDVQERRLGTPSFDPRIAHLVVPPGLYPDMMPEPSVPYEHHVYTPPAHPRMGEFPPVMVVPGTPHSSPPYATYGFVDYPQQSHCTMQYTPTPGRLVGGRHSGTFPQPPTLPPLQIMSHAKNSTDSVSASVHALTADTRISALDTLSSKHSHDLHSAPFGTTGKGVHIASRTTTPLPPLGASAHPALGHSPTSPHTLPFVSQLASSKTWTEQPLPAALPPPLYTEDQRQLAALRSSLSL
ncbi:Gluconate transport-inducing protein [Dispira simplex]|nr:Gluconate transport-inducing protein [Dispira simplex]